jgi:long-chain acyl-CoA synthetase
MIPLLLRRAVQQHGTRECWRSGGQSETWGEFGARVNHLAGLLRMRGVGRGDRVATLAENSPDYLALYFAVPWLGAAIVPLNNRMAPAEMSHCLRDADCRLLVHDQAYVSQASTLDVTSLALDEAEAERQPAGEPELSALDELFGIFYTGGTTGLPKGVMLSNANVLINALNCAREFRYDADTAFLHAAPMFHLADAASIYALTIAGAAHGFIGRFTVESLLEALERERITYTVLVPTMVQRLIDSPEFRPERLRTLRTIGYGAAPMPEALLRRAMSALPWCGFLQAYGMTELSPVATTLAPEYHVLEGPWTGKLRSAGRAVPGVEIRVVGPEGQRLPPGEPGEILVRGPTVMMGYWRQPEATAAAVRGGWMHTGDVGRLDEDGFLFVEDRIKDMIITGGENVYSAEVERVLHQHPAVAQCAVIGIPDDRWGEAVHAVVVLDTGANVEPGTLVEHCRAYLAPFKCPKSIVVRREPLPLSGAGKIQKAELKREFLASRSREP